MNGGAFVVKRKISERKQSFLLGVFLLSFSTLAVKVIGLAFKIPLLSFLGTEGMGYFNSAYEIYALLCIVATAGLPIALSMLVSRARAIGDIPRIAEIYRKSTRMFFYLGLVSSCLMLGLARPLSILIGNPNAYWCIVAIAPAVLFICISSAVRGYCQGLEDMLPTALSQLAEALCKLVLGLLFAATAKKYGYSVDIVAASAVLGITVGSLISMLYLLFAKRRRDIIYDLIPLKRKKQKGILRELVLIAFPITLGSTLIGLSRTVDMALIMRRLPLIGIFPDEANKIYGAYTTLAVPIFSLIPALIAPISMALVPELSALIESGKKEEQGKIVERSLRLCIMLALPASLGLAVFSRPVLELIFSGRADDITLVAPLLSVLGISVLFSCIITTSNAVLQSYGHTVLPIASTAVGVIVKLAVSYVLLGNARFGILGAPIGSLACNIAVSMLNVIFIARKCNCSMGDASALFKPLAASALSVGGAYLLYGVLDGRVRGYIALAVAVFAAAAVYFAALAVMKGITKEDISLFPGGKKVIKILKRN